MKKRILFSCALTLPFFFTSCKKNNADEPLPTADYSHGVLVSNEGSFSSGTGTVTSYDRYYNTATQDIFKKKNGFPIGNLVQSVGIEGERAYVVVNNAQKIEVVNLKDFAMLAAIESLDQPRYFLGLNSNKGYVTQWGDGSKGELKVIDLTSNTISKTIDIGKGSDRMIQSGNYVFVCNAGGYNPSTYDPVNDSAISVIDLQGDSLYRRIDVGYNPGGIVEDVYGKLWVICYGISDFNNASNNRPGALVRVNPATMTVELSLPFSTNDLGMRIAVNASKYKIYYQFLGHVYEMTVTSSVLPASSFINKNFYALGYDPVNSYIYGSDAGDFNSNGYVFRYNESGALVDSFMVGIGPGNFTFLPE
jgi:DNA-binding beta-propeller fold protein YncE